MKKFRLLIFLLYIILKFSLLTSCNKDNKNLIKGQLIIRETNQPLKGFLIQFDVANGSGFFSSVERAKYYATSDENGNFSFMVNGDEADNYFWVNKNSTGDHCWSDFDTTIIQYNYMLIDNERYILKDKKTKLIYSPRGVMDFYVSKETFSELDLDTVIVKSQYDSDTIICTHTWYDSYRNKTLYVEPCKKHTFIYIAIKNGHVFKQLTKEIYVKHICSHELGTPGSFYEVKFK